MCVCLEARVYRCVCTHAHLRNTVCFHEKEIAYLSNAKLKQTPLGHTSAPWHGLSPRMLCVCVVGPHVASLEVVLPEHWTSACVCVCQHLLHLRVQRGKCNTDQDNSYKDEWRRSVGEKDGKKNISCLCARRIAKQDLKLCFTCLISYE